MLLQTPSRGLFSEKLSGFRGPEERGSGEGGQIRKIE